MNMIEKQLADGLRELAGILHPFISETNPGTRVWDGTAYIPARQARHRDPYAFAWWSELRTAAELLGAADNEPSQGQIEFLRKELFGGMGSLLDFAIDERQFGEQAKAANQALERKLHALYPLFKL